VYIRIGKKGEPVVPKRKQKFAIGRSMTVRDGEDICLIVAGTLLPTVMRAAEELDALGIFTRVESFHTVKPLDETTLDAVFGRCKVVAVVEEHSRIGGLGGAVAEWLARQNRLNARLITFGTDDCFMHEVGTQIYAREKFGLTALNIVGKVKALFDRAPV
jgi:transketolase